MRGKKVADSSSVDDPLMERRRAAVTETRRLVAEREALRRATADTVYRSRLLQQKGESRQG